MIGFRNTDLDIPYFWEDDAQPAQRWHGSGEGPAQYLSTTPDASWAEFCRHQEIREPMDLAGVERAMWVVEFDDDRETFGEPKLPSPITVGDLSSYPACQEAARRIRATGSTALVTQSAAVIRESDSGWRVDGGLRRGSPRPELTLVLFGQRPNAVAWHSCAPGRPDASLLERVRYF